MLLITLAVGLGLLFVGGAWHLWSARLAGPASVDDQVFSNEVRVLSPSDWRDPRSVLRNQDKLRNVVVMVLELAIMVMSVVIVAYVLTQPGVPLWFEAATVATLAVGIALVARAMYVRAGMYEPIAEMEDLRTSLASTVGGETASDFASIRSTLDTARGDEGDLVTATVLAAARNDEPIDRIAEWGDTVGVDDPQTFHDQVEALEEAGIVEQTEEGLSIPDRLEDTDTDQLVTLATTVLD